MEPEEPEPPKRAVIYPRDIQRITFRSIRGARNLYQEIKGSLGRGKYEDITIQEFCTYVGIHETEVYPFFDD